MHNNVCVFVYGYIMLVLNYWLISIVLFTVQVESKPQKQPFSSPPSATTSRPYEKLIQPYPVTFHYPSKRMGQQNHSFIPKWFSTYSWLEYSIERDAAFCFSCCHFNTKSGKNEDVFINSGFSDWKHAAGKNGILQGHAGCNSHELCIHRTSISRTKGLVQVRTSIENHLHPTRCKQICNSRHYVKSVAETLLLTSHLEIAFRGHDASKSSLNKGNFLRYFE